MAGAEKCGGWHAATPHEPRIAADVRAWLPLAAYRGSDGARACHRPRFSAWHCPKIRGSWRARPSPNVLVWNERSRWQEGGASVIVLGVDPGLAHTGWGVIETRGAMCRARAYGCVATKRVISKFGPTALSIENVYFGENTKSAIATAQARGVAIVACANAGLEVGEYTPMQIKQAVVGTGAADKRQVMYMVKNVLALDREPHTDHAADALAAAVCHANLARTVSLGEARRSLT